MDFPEEVQKAFQQGLNDSLPSVALDVVIFGFHENELKVLLLRWTATNDWLLPGGRVFKQEDIDHAAIRVLGQRTGLHRLFLQQFHVFGKSDRYPYLSIRETWDQLGIGPLYDPDFRDISVGYYALVDYTKVTPMPDLLTDECRWWSIAEIPQLLFDHNEMIKVALRTLRRQLSYQPVGYNLLPEKFTMTDLQSLYETILNRTLDRRNFYKQMMNYGILERLEKRSDVPANMAPYLYRFNKERYDQLLSDEDLSIG